MSKTTSSESGKFPTPKLRISETIRVNCAAKLNLTFEILGRLPGGYHEIRTLFHSIDLEDVLRFSFMEAPELAIAISDDQSAPQSGIPIDNSNLIAIAAHAFAKKLSITNMRMLVSVRKSIPQGAGLAGGSANAAATLTAMNKAYNNVLNSDELLELAATIGSDVAFCLLGGTACGSLRGEQLLPVNCPQKISFVIAKPRNLSLSTAWMYNQYDEQFDQQPAPTQRSHNFDRALSALTAGDIKLATQSFGNDFEPLAFSFHPELKLLQNKLIELGCISCHMTGKGPTLFAVVSDLERAHSICERLIDQTDNEIDVWVAQSSEHGVRFLGN